VLDLDLRRGRCTDKERAMTGIAKSPRRDRRGRPKRGGTHQARHGECSSQRNDQAGTRGEQPKHLLPPRQLIPPATHVFGLMGGRRQRACGSPRTVA